MPSGRIERAYISRSEADLGPIAQDVLNTCNSARIFACYGDLGAGKTALIRQICLILGVEDPVTSPTFALIHEYAGREEMVYHFDLYRLRSEAEAYDIGCEEYFASGAWCLVEWAERIPSLLPDEAAHIRIEYLPDGGRSITLSCLADGKA
jgi:tRNA threonylcarbamoyladenosine biosynthesis protein TsaE